MFAVCLPIGRRSETQLPVIQRNTAICRKYRLELRHPSVEITQGCFSCIKWRFSFRLPALLRAFCSQCLPYVCQRLEGDLKRKRTFLLNFFEKICNYQKFVVYLHQQTKIKQLKTQHIMELTNEEIFAMMNKAFSFVNCKKDVQDIEREKARAAKADFFNLDNTDYCKFVG